MADINIAVSKDDPQFWGSGLKLSGGYQDIVTPDSAFDWLPFTIYGGGGPGAFNVGNFNLRDHAAKYGTMYGKAYYVDKAGDNSDGLSWATAYNNVWAAIGKTDVIEIHIAEGEYNFTNGDGGYQGDFGPYVRAVIGYGTVVLTSCVTGLSWALDTNHYEASTPTTIQAVWDSSNTESNGEYEELTLAADEAGVDSTPGTWFYDAVGDVIHVRTTDSREPDGDIRLGRNYGAGFNRGPDTDTPIYLENLSFRFCANRGIRYYQTNGCAIRLYMKDCEVSHVGNVYDGIDLDGVTEFIAQNCTVKHIVNNGDGIDYGVFGGIETKGIEIDCTIYNIRGSSTTQASSAHSASTSIRINGEYYETEGQVMAEDDAGHAIWMLGCHLHDSDSGYGYWGSNAWLEQVKIGTMAVYDINSAGTVRVRNCIRDGNGNGTIVAY